MKKLVVIGAVIGLIAVSCSNEEVEQLQVINEELKEQIRQKDVEVNDMLLGLESIQNDIRNIAHREDLLVGMKAGDIEFAESPQMSIIEDISLVDDLIKRNQEKIQSLELKVKSSDGKLYEFERVVANLKMDLLDRQEEIEQFKASLIELEEGYAELLDEYNEQLLISTIQDEHLHKAYFAYGSKEELEEMHVAEKEGGILGIGSTWKLKDDFNKEYFTELDIRDVQRLPLESEKVELVSSHPSESYELVMEGDTYKEIVITDPDNFWQGSRYLAVAVK